MRPTETADPILQQHAKALSDPSRFRIFDHIQRAHEPVAIAELTELLGFNHNAIRQHLAVLVDGRLISEMTETRTVRGRPRKLYQRRDDALNVFASISGSYEQIAELLLDLATTGGSAYDIGLRAGAAGVATNQSADADVIREDLRQQLLRGGYEPEADNGRLRLMHCPFAELAEKNQDIICELHRGLIDGHLQGQRTGLTAQLEPHPPHTAGCVVELRPRHTPTPG